MQEKAERTFISLASLFVTIGQLIGWRANRPEPEHALLQCLIRIHEKHIMIAQRGQMLVIGIQVYSVMDVLEQNDVFIGCFGNAAITKSQDRQRMTNDECSLFSSLSVRIHCCSIT